MDGIRVLVVDDHADTAKQLAKYLEAQKYEVHICTDLDAVRAAHDVWRPHVLVLVPTLEVERHHELGLLRTIYPRLPIVVVTSETGPDLILDVEAFAPALPARPSRGLGDIAGAVATASTLH